jgi:hypothetical protein
VIVTLTLKYGKKTFLILGLVILLIEYHYYYVNIKGYFVDNGMTYGKYYQFNPTIPELPSSSNLFRIYFDTRFANNASVINEYGLQGYESNVPNVYGDLINVYGFSPHFWQIANVKYVITTQNNFEINRPELLKIKTINPSEYPDQFLPSEYTTPYYIYEVRGYLPRYYIPQNVNPCLDLKCWKKENAPKLVLAKGIPRPIKNPTKNTKITLDKYTDNTIEITITTPQQTFIASSETYDQGWNLLINNKQSTIYNISNGLRGFIVPSGKSVVKMSYFPPNVLEGSFLSIVGVILLYISYRLYIKKS